MRKLTREEILELKGLVQDAMFWIELDAKPDSNEGFKFLAATYGLTNAQQEASQKGLQGKEKEKFIRPHQDLYTIFNPYSGNGNDKNTS